MKKNLLKLIAPTLLLVGCAGTPKMTDLQLVSVSWVNTSPVPVRNIQTRLNRTYAVFSLEELPPYREVGVEADILLPEHPKVETAFTMGGQQINLPSGYAADPERASPDGEYNLRIHMTRGQLANIHLEPAHVAQARLESAADTH